MIATIVLSILINPIFASQKCLIWFKGSGAVAGTANCELKCASHMTDMGTFDCPSDCEDLCKGQIVHQQPDSNYLKGVSKADREVAIKHPKEALVAFKAKQDADRLTDQVFGVAGRNDESDAFRHFIWASLLTKELGIEKARIFLEAHEKEPLQPKAEFEMDTANNEAGVAYAKAALEKGDSLDLDKIEKEALARLREKKLKVIKPSKKKIPDGYYSK